MAAIGKLRFLLLMLAGGVLLACAGTPRRSLPLPPQPGALSGSVSVQFTSSSKELMLWSNSADFSKAMEPAVRRGLKDTKWELSGKAAEQHLVVNVKDSGRGMGKVSAYCDLEIYLYAKWPGELAHSRNPAQDEKGALSNQKPLLHLSLFLEDKRRKRGAGRTALGEGAKYCAKHVVSELNALRETAPPALPVVKKAPTKKPAPVAEAAPPAPIDFSVSHELQQGPGNLTVTPMGVLIVSLHQFFDPAYPVAIVAEDGSLSEFAAEAQLDSVLGVQSDENGVVWLLDNGMKSTKKPRLVGYHSVRKKIVADIDLSSVAPPNAFFNDLVIDLDHQTAYLAEPAGGDNAAVVVVDLESGKSRRLLEGHVSVMPEDVDLVVDGKSLELLLPSGKRIQPRVGVNPIAADANNEWLYFGPMHGLSLYRVKTSDLRDPALSKEQLAKRVERFSDKPICDGISMDRDGNIYLGDLAHDALVRISPDGQSRRIATDPRLSWLDAFSFGPDGKLYGVANQLHRSARLHGGKDETIKPFLIVDFVSEAGGVIGR